MHRSDNLRVLFVNDISYIVETLVPELSRIGVDATVIGANPSQLSPGKSSFSRTVCDIWSEMRRVGDYDILHINYALFGFVGFAQSRPIVLHCHGSDIRNGPNPKTRLTNMISGLGMLRANRIWYSTLDLAPLLTGIKVTHRYMPSPVSSSFFDARLEEPSIPHVLFAVPLSRVKGAEITCALMRELVDRNPTIRVSTFSFAPRDEEAATFRRKIPSSVELLNWRPHSELPGLFARASVVVGQMGIGALGVSELEALAAGKPLVSRISQPVSKVSSYYAEEPPIIQYSGISDTVDQILGLIERPSRAFELGKKSREWARRYHSAEVVARLYKREYEEVADQGS